MENNCDSTKNIFRKMYKRQFTSEKDNVRFRVLTKTELMYVDVQ